MRIRRGIEDERTCRMPRLLYPADKLALMIRLPEIDLQTGGLSLLLKAQLYIRQRLFAVNLRLPLADEILDLGH